MWNKFGNKLDALLKGSHTITINQETYWTHSLLNKHWDLFQDLLIKAAEKCIPIRKSSGQFKYPRPSGLNKLYLQQKTLHKFKKLLLKVKQGDSFPANWIQMYDKYRTIANSLTFITAHPHPNYPFNFVDLLLSDTALLLKVLLCKAKIHENEYKLSSIQKNLEQRLDAYANDPKKMLDSVLNRARKTIVLDRCLSRNTQDLLTDEHLVKQTVNDHFQRAAGTTHELKDIPEEWIPSYNPLEDINANIYNSLMSPPTAEE